MAARGTVLGIPIGLVIGAGVVWLLWRNAAAAAKKPAPVSPNGMLPGVPQWTRGLPGEKPASFYAEWHRNLPDEIQSLVAAYIADHEKVHGIKPYMSDVYNVFTAAWERGEEVPWPTEQPEGPGAWEWEKVPGGRL